MDTVTISLEKYESMKNGIDEKIQKFKDESLMYQTQLSTMTRINRKLQEVLKEDFNCILQHKEGNLILVNNKNDTRKHLCKI